MAEVFEDPCRCERFEALLARYAGEHGALIPVLQAAQDIFGYLPPPVLSRIAKATGQKESEVYGVASFYAQFRFEPIGEHLIKACHGTACHVAGAERTTEALSTALGVGDGGTTADGRFTLQKVACLGCCSLAPVIMVDDKAYGRLTPDSVVAAVRGHEGGRR
jgi:NADH-quinone oxidoreductase subunit E